MTNDLMFTAVSDNSPSCNLYTLTETRTLKFSDGLTEQQIKELLKQHTVELRDTWPCNQSKLALIPLDGHLADRWDRDMFGGRWRRSSCAGPSSSPFLLMTGREDPVLLQRGFERYTSRSKSSGREAEEAKARRAYRGLG
jgi:hypothetical protein